MIRRGYKPNLWKISKYFSEEDCEMCESLMNAFGNEARDAIYIRWHDDRYLKQCLCNLQEKADCGAIPADEWKQITDKWPEYE